MAAQEKAEKAPELVRATVARGRTLIGGNPRPGRDGAVYRVDPVEYPPGSIVDLPAGEVVRLQKIGFLETPGAQQLQPSEGPNFGDEPGRVTAR